jgi:hypothetical protein
MFIAIIKLMQMYNSLYNFVWMPWAWDGSYPEKWIELKSAIFLIVLEILLFLKDFVRGSTFAIGEEKQGENVRMGTKENFCPQYSQ